MISRLLDRPRYLDKLAAAMRRSPVTALLGPRQCGKTTLARMFGQKRVGEGEITNYYDLESLPDQRRMENPELVLGACEGIVILDEVQMMPHLFAVLRVLVDRPENKARFLLLGSASPDIIKNVSDTLAGRVEFIDISGFDLQETDPEDWQNLWMRGGFPRSYLALSDEDSMVWRQNFIQTFLTRDIPQLGINIPSPAMHRFWIMLSHYHGQTWKASALARAMGLSDKTVRSYLDILTGTYMIRQLQPWYANIKKRQVKAPKIYLRDPGILHSLLNIPDFHSLLGHPRIGASWEGFALEQTLKEFSPSDAYFWSTHSGAELDLFFFFKGKRFGAEFKFNEAPKITKSMRTAMKDLQLDHLWIIYPGKHVYPADENITVCPPILLENEVIKKH